MAALGDVSPEDVHAVVVGLEWYPRSGWPIPGAADDAVRFAEWLRRCGVPAANIQLLISPQPDGLSRLNERAGRFGLTVTVPKLRDHLLDTFGAGLDHASGRLLYVFWGGHGVKDHDHGRVLLTPDATSDDQRCLSVEGLREYLTRPELSGFARHVFFFDCCATFIERHNTRSRPALAEFPPRDRQAVEQFVLHAAADGQAAAHDPVARTGTFSRAVLECLDDKALGLLPDMTELARDVELRLERALTEGLPRQSPVLLWFHGPDGGAEKLVPMPATLVDLETVARGLHEAVPDPDQRAEYARTVRPKLPRAAESSVEEFARALLTAPRAMADLIGLLRRTAPEAADRIADLSAALPVPGLLSQLEIGELTKVLSKAEDMPAAHGNAMLRQTLLGGYGAVWAKRGTIEPVELIDQIEQLEKHRLGAGRVCPSRPLVPAVLRFTECLAAARPKLREGLWDWGKRVATRLGIDLGALAERRDLAGTWAMTLEAPRRQRLVAQLFPEPTRAGGAASGAGGQTYTCVLWIDDGSGELVRSPHQRTPTPLSAAQIVESIEDSMTDLPPCEEPPIVEIVLPRDALPGINIGSWNGSLPDDDEPVLLSVERQVVLRCAPLASDRRERKRREQLRDRWQHHHAGTVAYLDDKHVSNDLSPAYSALHLDQKATRAVIRAGEPARSPFVRLAIGVGYPVVLWDVEAGGPLPEDHFDTLRPKADVHGLPERVRGSWAQAHAEPTARRPRPALLMEDADKPPPPVLPINDPTTPN